MRLLILELSMKNKLLQKTASKPIFFVYGYLQCVQDFTISYDWFDTSIKLFEEIKTTMFETWVSHISNDTITKWHTMKLSLINHWNYKQKKVIKIVFIKDTHFIWISDHVHTKQEFWAHVIIFQRSLLWNEWVIILRKIL